MDYIDLNMYVNENEDDGFYQCFTRQERYKIMDPSFNLMKECCNDQEQCYKPGHRFTVHVFESFELPQNYFGSFKREYKVGVKQIPWLTSQNEEIQLNFWFHGEVEKGNMIKLKGLGDQ